MCECRRNVKNLDNIHFTLKYKDDNAINPMFKYNVNCR